MSLCVVCFIISCFQYFIWRADRYNIEIFMATMICDNTSFGVSKLTKYCRAPASVTIFKWLQIFKKASSSSTKFLKMAPALAWRIFKERLLAPAECYDMALTLCLFCLWLQNITNSGSSSDKKDGAIAPVLKPCLAHLFSSNVIGCKT